MITNIQLIKIDTFADYIPVVSTVTNLVDLFFKAVVLPTIEKKNHYYTHIDDKSVLRCLILLIPILGNLIVAIYDLTREQGITDREIALQVIAAELENIGLVGPTLRKDKQFAIEALKQDGQKFKPSKDVKIFQNLDETLRADAEVVKVALESNTMALEFAAEALKDNEEIVNYAVDRSGLAIQFASARLRADKILAKKAVKKTAGAFDHLADSLKQDTAFVNELKQLNPVLSRKLDKQKSN